MYEGDAFEETVEELVAYLDSLDADSVDPMIEENGEVSRSVTIHVEETEGPNYFIEGNEGDRFFYIKCYYNLVIDLAVSLSVDQVREKREEKSTHYPDEDLLFHLPPRATLVDGQSDATWPDQRTDEEEEAEASDAETDSEGIRVWRDRIAAALDTVDGVSEEDQQEIIFNLVDIFSNVPVKFRVNMTQGMGLAGLVVRERIFPYEDSFHIKSLDESIVRTRIPANMGMLFFQYVYDLNIRQDKEETIADTPPERPNFPS